MYDFMRFLVLIALATSVIPSRADTLRLDASRSQVTLTGTVAGYTLREQATGSLSSTIGGTIDLNVSAGQIQITNALLAPNINGSWAPGTNGQASSSADFGGMASTGFGPITGALRDLVVNVISPPRTLQANGQFDASTLVFSFPANSSSVLDYTSFLTGPGSKQLAGAGTNQTATVGTFVNNGGTETLTIALDATFYFKFITDNDTALTLKGQLVATNAPAQALPTFTEVRFENGQVIFTATGTSDATQVQSTTTLTSWSPQPATIGSPDSSTRTFTVPMDKPYDFFRLTQ
jgi:hypothetical protein